MKNWHGIMKIVEIKHLGRYGEVLWQQNNIKNLLHAEGEEFILRATFTDTSIVPPYYYLGMDNRTTLLVTDTMADIISEPNSQYGYFRQDIGSAGEFMIAQESGHFVASSPIKAFRAQNGSWGPVTNLFLTDQEGNSGKLISSAQFESPITVDDGESITMRIALSLKDCPAY